jgi:hypothetical protein
MADIRTDCILCQFEFNDEFLLRSPAYVIVCQICSFNHNAAINKSLEDLDDTISKLEAVYAQIYGSSTVSKSASPANALRKQQYESVIAPKLISVHNLMTRARQLHAEKDWINIRKQTKLLEAAQKELSAASQPFFREIDDQ